MSVTLETSVSLLHRVGERLKSKLAKLEINIVRDLIFYYPARYDDLSLVQTIDQVVAGTTATVAVVVEMITNRRSWKKKIMLTEAVVSDETGTMKAVWFHQPYLAKTLKPGDHIFLSGKVAFDEIPQFTNPTYEKNRPDGQTIHTARLVPIYPTTQGLTQKQIRWLISLSLPAISQVTDWLPAQTLERNELLSLAKALQQIHFPDNRKSLEAAIRRLKFDELILFSLQLQIAKQESDNEVAPAITFQQAKTQAFVQALPFSLTDDQKKSSWEILQDIQKPVPMNRLLEGEVGSGKTLVAALAAYNVALSGRQTLFMAPTDILAKQHFQTLKNLFSSNGLRVGLLTRTTQGIDGQTVAKRSVINALSKGTIDIIVGTHALLQETISFASVGLIVVDEQHRFGVLQRKRLLDKSGSGALVPHFLSMTATPIPRSLALTLYGDLKVSMIRQLPKERQPIKTQVVTSENREKCYRAIREQVALGRQAFVICPLIDVSDRLGVKSVTEEFEHLHQEVFPDLTLGKLHGKLPVAERDKTMEAFARGEIAILVTTSVIEVGVNVPNATVVMIESAERFGLAQLHQFRGRVGRGEQQSYCYLLMDTDNEKSQERLLALTTARDGFALAELDLELRGPGELFGVSQSGIPTFKIANLFDYELVVRAKKEAELILAQDETLQQHPQVQQRLAQANELVHRE